jgi:transposase
LINNSLEIAATPPQAQAKVGFNPRWTLKRLVEWIKDQHHLNCCRHTIGKALKKLGFSWKKWRKLLNKGSPQKRQEFLDKLSDLLKSATQDEKQVVYLDEAHIHLDTDEGYGWSVKGQRAWISSSSPGLAKVSFYGVYFYNQGQVNILPFESANGDNTMLVLKKIREDAGNNDPIILIWDNASYHRRKDVIRAAQALNIKIQPLPAYSPDFMPVEHLWQWLREDITYHTCYDQKSKLIAQVQEFEQSINKTPIVIAARLWAKTSLNSDEEKLRFSK